MIEPRIPDEATLNRISECLDARIDRHVEGLAARRKRLIRSLVVGASLAAACGIGLLMVQSFTDSARIEVRCLEVDLAGSSSLVASSSFDLHAIDSGAAIAFCSAPLAVARDDGQTSGALYSLNREVEIVVCTESEATLAVVSDPGGLGPAGRCAELGLAPAP